MDLIRIENLQRIHLHITKNHKKNQVSKPTVVTTHQKKRPFSAFQYHLLGRSVIYLGLSRVEAASISLLGLNLEVQARLLLLWQLKPQTMHLTQEPACPPSPSKTLPTIQLTLQTHLKIKITATRMKARILSECSRCSWNSKQSNRISLRCNLWSIWKHSKKRLLKWNSKF
jgi:hypothetical protein